MGLDVSNYARQSAGQILRRLGVGCRNKPRHHKLREIKSCLNTRVIRIIEMGLDVSSCVSQIFA